MDKKVLIVEDSRTMCRVLSYLIHQQPGFSPVVLPSLADCKAYLQTLDADARQRCVAAIVDINLPDAPDGEAIDLLMDYQIPVIVLSGRVDDTLRSALLEKGVVDYLNKEGRYVYEFAVKLVKRLALNPSIKSLVVDDSAVTRGLMVSLLKQYNIEPMVASNGVEALDLLQQHPDIRLLITDYNMAKMDGFELTTRIRQHYSPEQLVIIGVSMENCGELSAKFIKNGANDFLRKPFSNEEFHCRVMQNLELLETIDQLHIAATTDELTGLYNRRYFFEEGEKKLQRCQKNQTDCCAILMDLDHFKQINDSYGHQAGDQVLEQVAELFQLEFDGELYARYGGEEFAMLLPGTSLEDAASALNSFRAKLQALQIHYQGQQIGVTVSIGISDQGADLDAMLKQADELLYQAKAEGRNQVVY